MTRSSTKLPLCTAIALACLGAAQAHATPAPVGAYISVTAGATTLGPLVDTSGGMSDYVPMRLTIARGGTVVASQDSTGSADIAQAPQVGDVVTVEYPRGTAFAAATYDGRPTLDATVCGGSANFSGQRTAAADVGGGFYTASATSPYGVLPGSSAQAHVSTLAGSAFAGSFARPVAAGQTAYAYESLTSQLSGGATLNYYSETDRPVVACPGPPPGPKPPTPPAPVPPLQGKILKLTKTTLAKLLKSGWTFSVQINQPGTVLAGLFLKGGKLPASAAKAKPALRVARGTATAKSAGTVKVHLRVTAAGRRKLKHSKKAKLVLLTTLRSATGAKLDLGRKSLSLHR